MHVWMDKDHDDGDPFWKNECKISIFGHFRGSYVWLAGQNWANLLQREQSQMHKSIKLLLRDTKKHKFEIYFLSKSIDWRFLY